MKNKVKGLSKHWWDRMMSFMLVIALLLPIRSGAARPSGGWK